MTKPSKYYLEIQKKLESPNEIHVLDTIKEIRYSGKPEIIPLLLNLINSAKSTRIIQEVLTLFSQLKDQNCVPYIADALKEKDFGEKITPLIASCWQSGLDYSNHLNIFADLLIEGSYYVALESFTVIEESAHVASQEAIQKCILALEEKKHLVTTEKLPLFKALLDVLEAMR